MQRRLLLSASRRLPPPCGQHTLRPRHSISNFSTTLCGCAAQSRTSRMTCTSGCVTDGHAPARPLAPHTSHHRAGAATAAAPLTSASVAFLSHPPHPSLSHFLSSPSRSPLRALPCTLVSEVYTELSARVRLAWLRVRSRPLPVTRPAQTCGSTHVLRPSAHQSLQTSG